MRWEDFDTYKRINFSVIKQKSTMPKEEEAKPKPAPPTRYGPTFDEIERRDPVQWHAAHMAWVR